jgi:hypothetical protein
MTEQRQLELMNPFINGGILSFEFGIGWKYFSSCKMNGKVVSSREIQELRVLGYIQHDTDNTIILTQAGIDQLYSLKNTYRSAKS